MKSKCKCSLSFLDNQKLCHGFFPSYCIIIIINKKERTTEDFSYADVSFYLYNHSIRPFPWPVLKDSFKMWVSRGPVPGARVAANPRLLSCKYHTLWNVGRKEDLEGPMQVCNKSPGPPLWDLDWWPGGTELYIIESCVSRGECTMYSASVTFVNESNLILDITWLGRSHH